MELRLDRLLGKLRDNAAAILEAIDDDPLLLKRQSGALVLANASFDYLGTARSIAAARYPYATLLFAALDGRLDRERIRRIIRDPKQARQALNDLGLV